MAQSGTSKESDMQSLLNDERERCNQHKQLYQTLKEEHAKLKNELTLVYEQLREAVSKNEHIQASKDSHIRRLEEQIQEKQGEIHQLTEEVKSFNPQKIRDSVIEEATSHYEGKIKELHAEADTTREQYNILHYEHAVLKSQFESHESEFSHEIERIKFQHLEEIEHLQSKIDLLEKEKSFPEDSNAIELKSAKHDILHLNSKLKGLLAECDELRAQNENLTLQLNSTNRTHLKQIADNITNIRMLESEKQKAVMQREVLEKELSNLQEQRRIINNDLQSTKREMLSLRNKLEECEHRCRMMATEVQVENEHLKREHETEKEQLMDEISRIKIILKDTTAELNHTQQILMAKEQELQQSILIARQHLWKQSNESEQERDKMERIFQDFKKHKELIISELSNEVQVLQNNLKQCTESKLELEKELLTIREKKEEALKDTDTAKIEVLTKQNFNYKNDIKELKEQIDILKATNITFIEEKDKMLHNLLSRRKDENSHDDEREILQLKFNWEQQKYQFHQRLEDLESQLRESRNSAAAELKESERKIQKYSRIATKLKEKLDSQKIKNEELENEREVLEKNVPYEIHLQVMNKLTELQRKLEQYRLIIGADPHFAHCSSSAPMPDKLLTDIKNLQLRIPSFGETMQQYENYRLDKGKSSDRTAHPKRTTYIRRRSLKARNRENNTKLSPVISSSSDLDVENL